MSGRKKSIWDEVYEATKRQLFFEHLERMDAEEEKYSWRDYHSSDFELGVSVYDYETEEEFEAALAIARLERYSWRMDYDCGDDIDPEDYETEEEFLEAVEEERYSWRMDYDCEDDIDPEDYETEEEFLEAVEEEKYSWREEYLDIFDPNPRDYETEEEYLEALEGCDDSDDW